MAIEVRPAVFRGDMAGDHLVVSHRALGDVEGLRGFRHDGDNSRSVPG